MLPLGWHAAMSELGTVLLQCEPEPGKLLIEAGNLIERMATSKEPVPADWRRLSQDAGWPQRRRAVPQLC